MEQKNKSSYPSLPSNYVTLVQLRERWLKQQNQINQQPQQKEEEEKIEDQHKQQQQQQQEKPVVVVAPTNGTVSKSHPVEQHRLKNRDDSTNYRRAVEVASENRRNSETGAGIGENRGKSGAGAAIEDNRRKSETGAAIGENRRKPKNGAGIEENRWKSETGAGIGDEKADLDIKVGKSKKKNGAGIGKNRRKSETRAGIRDEKADLDSKVEKSKKKNGNRRWKGKMKPKVEERGEIEEGTTPAEGKEVAEKTTIKSELNDEKNVSSITVEEVEQKIGVRQSQSQRNYHRGGGVGYGHGYKNFRDQKRSNVRSVWVRKDGGVGEKEP